MPDDRSTSTSRWLYLLFFASGISGLMYEVVWVRMLTRILGSTSFATSTVLAVFMGGLALGCLLAGRFADRIRNPLAVYALLELLIGASAFLSLALPDRLVPLYRTLYAAVGDSRALLTVIQVLVAMLVLLLPTTLMGATLPTLCAYGTRRLTSFGRCVGTLYAVNTIGACIGVAASGFVLIGAVGETATITIGAVLNAVIAATSFALSRGQAAFQVSSAVAADADETSVSPQPSELPLLSRRQQTVVLISFFVAGFAALANEVIWGRMLILYQGTSIYAFSGMLCVVLIGIGYGSYWMGKRVDAVADPYRTFSRVQVMIGAASALALFSFTIYQDSLAVSLVNGTNLSLIVLAPLTMLGPVTFLWGIAFPLAARCCQSTVGSGRTVSTLYTCNTVGSILGALAGGFLLIPNWGASLSAVGLAVVSLLMGSVLCVMHQDGLKRSAGGLEWAMIIAAVVMLIRVDDPYYSVIARRAARSQHKDATLQVYRHQEGASGTVTAFGPYKQLWVNGYGMTHLCTEAKLMAHLPVAMSEDPSSLLVICYGMGTTVRSASLHEGLEVWSVEIQPDIYNCAEFFHEDAPGILARPNVHPIADDGRNFLLMNDRRFDIITIDPAPPFYSAGTVNLYTREFFALCQSRLTDAGIMCQWIPPWTDTEVDMVIRSYLDVFENVSIWSGPEFPGLYLLGSRQKLTDLKPRLDKLFEDPHVVEDLTEFDERCATSDRVIKLHVAEKSQVMELFKSSPIMTDDLPLTEFPLWRALSNKKPRPRTSLTLVEDLRALYRKKRQTAQSQP